MFKPSHTAETGFETACLIRRLRSFCNAETSHTICVATSATIVDHDDPEATRKFASRFFGVAPQAVATIGEDYAKEIWDEPRFIPPEPGVNPDLILNRCVQAVEDKDPSGAGIREAYQLLSGQDLGQGSWPEALHQALSYNDLVFGLNQELKTPRALADLPETLEQRVGRPVTEAEILAWLTLGAAGRQKGRPLLRPIVHRFVRGIGGAVVTFPEDADGAQLWLAAEDKPQQQESGKNDAHFPVTWCTTCGQHYYVAFLKDFEFTRRQPSGGDAGPEDSWWTPLEETLEGRRVLLIDHLIGAGDDEEMAPKKRTSPLHYAGIARSRSLGSTGARPGTLGPDEGAVQRT